MKRVFSLFGILFLATLAMAQSDKRVLKFGGNVFFGNDKAEGVTVSIYDGNYLVSESKTSRNGKFAVDLAKNKHYTVQFDKDGFMTKRIVIDTEIGEDGKDNVKTFKFDVGLIKRESGKDYSILDFPIAIIKYHAESNQFYYDNKYTEHMLEAQKDIEKSEARMASK